MTAWRRYSLQSLSRRQLLQIAAIGLGAGAIQACTSPPAAQPASAPPAASPAAPAPAAAQPTTAPPPIPPSAASPAAGASPAAAAPAASPAATRPQVQGKPGGKLIIARSSESPTLDPHVNSVTVDGMLFHAMFDRLIQRSPDGTLYPALATEWKTLDNGVTWQFKLRTGVKFHDGTEFDAEAAKFNFERIVNPETKSEYAVFQLGPFESAKAIDKTTLEIKMKRPFGPLPVALATYAMSMVSPAGVQKHGAEFARNPVGSGPFKFKEWVSRNRIVLEKNPDYNWASPIEAHTGPAYLDEVTIRFIPEAATLTAALKSGEVDLAFRPTAADFAQFGKDANYRVQQITTEGYPPPGIFINTTKAPTDDVKVRQALGYAINIEQIQTVVFEGTNAPADNVVSKFNWAYDPAAAIYKLDQRKAEQLLDDAGWKKGAGQYRQKDGQELKIVYLSLTGVKQIAEVVQAQLRPLGVNIEIVAQDNPAQQQFAQSAQHNMVWTQWSGVDPSDLRKVYGSENVGIGWNFAHYKNTELDKLFEQGEAEVEPARRKVIYGQVQKILMEAGTFIPLNNLTILMAMKKDIQGTDVIDERGAGFRLYNTFRS